MCLFYGNERKHISCSGADPKIVGGWDHGVRWTREGALSASEVQGLCIPYSQISHLTLHINVLNLNADTGGSQSTCYILTDAGRGMHPLISPPLYPPLGLSAHRTTTDIVVPCVAALNGNT